jgi:ribosomal protein S11
MNEVTHNGDLETASPEFNNRPRSGARLLQQVGFKLQNNRTLRSAKTSARKAADWIHEHSLKDVSVGFRGVLRQKPEAALVVAAVAGFLIGRSLRRR